jgi:hypothetical protein
VDDGYTQLDASYDNGGDGLDDGDIAVAEPEPAAADAEAHASEICTG